MFQVARNISPIAVLSSRVGSDKIISHKLRFVVKGPKFLRDKTIGMKE